MLKITNPSEIADFAAWRESATSEARKMLHDELAEAKNLQQKTIDDSVKLKIVGADGKNPEYRDKVEGKTFWGSLVHIAEAGKEKGIKPSILAAAVAEELGNPDSFDNRANTVKQYRSTFPKVLDVYMSPNYEAACKLVGKDKDGNWVACDKDGHALPLHRLSYAAARKAFSQFSKTDEERAFAAEIQGLVSDLKTAAKNRAKNEDEGLVALAGVPLKTMIETVQTLRGLIPERGVVALDEGKAADDMAAAADEGAEAIAPPAQQVVNG